MKIQDMLSTGVDVLLVSKAEVLVDNIELNCWKKRKEKGRLRSYGFLTGNRRHVSNSDLPRQQVCQTGATCCERKGPTAYSISFLVGFIKELGFRRIILKCDNEPSTKALQDAVIHACVVWKWM